MPHSFRAALVGFALLPLAQFAQAQTTLPGLPDTPPARLMSAWITAINSADRAKIQAFLDQSWPGQALADTYLARAQATGGYNVGQVLQSTDARISVLLQKRADTTAYNTVTVTVAPNAPTRVVTLTVLAGTARAAGLSTPTSLSGAALDAAKAGAAYKLFTTWLETFNTGDKARIQSFLDKNWPSGSIDGQTGLRERSGGYELPTLESATPTGLVGTMKEKSADRYARFTLSVDAADPTKIVRLAIVSIPKP